MGLREKLLNAAESEDWIRYNADQIQEVFLEALRTGLRDDSVKSRIETWIIPGTKASEKTDSDIVSKLKAIDAEEAIRRDKLEQSRSAVSSRPTLKVNEINLPQNNTQNAPMSSFESALMDKMNEMSDNMKTVKDLSATVEKLEKKMSEMETQRPVQKFNKKKWGCDHCVENKRSSCPHCFVCGAGDHKSFDPNCPRRKGN